MVHVCLIRHAIAEDRGARYPDDSQRPLTAAGREKMEQAATGLRGLFVPEVILTSPFVRAHQTAEIVARAAGVGDIRVSKALASGDNHQLVKDIRAAGLERVACTGHEPYMSQTLSYFLTGDDDTLSSVYKKGAAGLVGFSGVVEAGEGWLEWLLQPGQLRLVATGLAQAR